MVDRSWVFTELCWFKSLESRLIIVRSTLIAYVTQVPRFFLGVPKLRNTDTQNAIASTLVLKKPRSICLVFY